MKIPASDAQDPISQLDSLDGTELPEPEDDVDRMVSGFLSELNALSDSLSPPREEPADESDEPFGLAVTESAASIQNAGEKNNEAATSPTPKPAYRNIDVLLMDNAQFMAGKERAQEEFSHKVNARQDTQSAGPSEDSNGRRSRALGRAIQHVFRRETQK